MKKIVSLFAMVALAGSMVACGGKDDCETAADRIAAKMDECGAETEETDSGDGDAECTDAVASGLECTADCAEAASCDDIVSVDFTNDYYACIAACSM